jgi:pimeloyl-ACP methyl ester carboxylesterase
VVKLWMGCLLSSLVVWFWLSLCQVFLVGHDWGATIGWEVCRLRPDWVIAYVAVSVPFHIRQPDGSAIQKMTKLLGEGFYWNRFQVNSQTLFQVFLQTIHCTSRVMSFLYSNWFKRSSFFLSGHLSWWCDGFCRNLEEQNVILQV